MSTLAKTERVRDADRTRAELLAVATQVFAEDGYSGARVDEIAERTRTTKRMIYYYFGGKEQLYLAVLEQAYTTIREAENNLPVDDLAPVDALRKLAELTYDHHREHPDFIRLVSIENIHRGEFVRRIDSLRTSVGADGLPAGCATGAGPCRGAVPVRRRRGGRSPGDQRVLRLPGRQPAHLPATCSAAT